MSPDKLQLLAEIRTEERKVLGSLADPGVRHRWRTVMAAPHFQHGNDRLGDFRRHLIDNGLSKYQARQVVGRSRARAFFDENRRDDEPITLSFTEFRRLRTMIRN